ncbi:Copper-exporting P-type ATPase A [Botrimarina colliarenosi]|uniref:Copper-exporting P-type ATPase A n=1 Tax=Botrimarina colliarenosi TaxID=2528001 RepID=A0A5C6AHC3_9BACT|nr:Copper-exporting P-type ATPase A [Botrimarina colliarenosi]
MVRCDHCGLPVPAALQNLAGAHQFCCGGCEVAFETIRGCGLENYYAVRDRVATERHSAKGAGKPYAAYDTDAFLSRHTTVTDGGYQAINFRLEGVHCAACVWLVERLPSITGGVVDARLSLGNSRARIVWDPEQTTLSAIATTLDRLGYAPHPARDASAHQARNRTERSRLTNMAIAGALAGNNMLIAVALYAGAFEGIEPQFAQLFRWLSLLIGCLSLAWPGRTFFRSAWTACRSGAASLDQPIALALGIGALAGSVNVVLKRGEIYFDSLSVLVFLLLVGRFLQSRQQRWAEEAVGLTLSMTPDTCRVLREGSLCEESTESLVVGDEVEVRPGELLPADGTVTAGQSSVDQGLLTGESRPLRIGEGTAVFAGSQNLSATLRVTVNAVGDATRVGKLIRLVEDGLADKPPIVRFADQVGGVFVVVVALLAAANLAWWSITTDLGGAIESTVALLIVACPCALGLATPLTMAVAIGRGSRRGILIKSAAVLEKLASVDTSRPGTAFLDKTGTLTNGRHRVEAYFGRTDLKAWIAVVESQSIHPIGKALLSAFGPIEPTDALLVRERVEQHGYGVLGVTPDGDLLVGSPRFANERGAFVDREMSDAIRRGGERGHTVVVAALNQRVVTVIWLSDELQPDAKAHLDRLRRDGWNAEILSGDSRDAVQAVAARLGFGSAAIDSMAPEQKLAKVRAAVAAGGASVMMVGDGINDAAALAAADVGVAVHGGAEASLAAADVYLTEPGIGKLVDLVELARSTMRVTRRNLVISLGYNTIAVVLAAAGWITPLAAALLMPLSSLTVLTSAVVFESGNREPLQPPRREA